MPLTFPIRSNLLSFENCYKMCSRRRRSVAFWHKAGSPPMGVGIMTSQDWEQGYWAGESRGLLYKKNGAPENPEPRLHF